MVMEIPKRKIGRPKGSKSESHGGYARRTEELKRKYGSDIFKRWGRRRGQVVDLG